MSENPHLYSSENPPHFDPIKEINQVKGPLIEIGGPTPLDWRTGRSYEMVDTTKLSKKIITTNLEVGFIPSEFDEEEEEYIDGELMVADMRVDGQALPFKSESIGAIFASALPIDIRRRVLREVYRVLEPGGLLVWQYGRPVDKRIAHKRGLKTMRTKKTNLGSYNYIFKKV